MPIFPKLYMVHTYIYTYMHAYIYTCMHTYIQTCMPACIYIYIHNYIHNSYMHTYVCMHIHFYGMDFAFYHLYVGHTWSTKQLTTHYIVNCSLIGITYHQLPLTFGCFVSRIKTRSTVGITKGCVSLYTMVVFICFCE